MRRRNRKTRPAVKAADRVARLAITLGGIGTIIAVSTVCLFLVWVVLPLFGSTRLEATPASVAVVEEAALQIAVDEYRSLAWSLGSDGTLSVFRPDTGAVLSESPLIEGEPPTAVAFDMHDETAAAGFADGTIRRGRVGFRSTLLDDEDVLGVLPEQRGDHVPYREGVLERIADGQLRYTRVERSFDAAVPIDASGSAVVKMDYAVAGSGPTLAVVTADGKLHVRRVKTRRNLLTGVETATLSGSDLDLREAGARELPDFVALTGLGDNVLLVWDDGRMSRYDCRKVGSLELVEEAELLTEDDTEVSALGFLIGRKTLIVGDTRGGIAGWFRIKPEGAATPDGAILAKAWSFAGQGVAVTSLAPSARTRMFAAGFASGDVGVYQATVEATLAIAQASRTASPVTALAMGPKDDAVVAMAELPVVFDLEVAHPESSFAAMFRPIWYEGYEKAEHVWQSSGGSDDFEPKLGLMPLVFGTLKATLYSMLFGLPIALLAAIYTSEFLHPSVKSRIKPTIELMASLPSVVLGFLAALVFAPYLEKVLPAALASIFAVPFTLLLGAHLWQLLPSPMRARMSGRRFLLCALLMPVGVAFASLAGPLLEAVLFDGDLRLWLDGGSEATVGGWMLLLLPLVALLSAVAAGRSAKLDTLLANLVGEKGPAWASLLRFGLVTLASIGGTALLASLVAATGADPRGGILDTYVQRNALVVGFAMGFAVIPIIYTIAEDALSTIPETLRAGSLALGATPWQTAVRIVVPTAMSGLFSATMVGLGRAVGETMIVLMAAGNTPVMEWNIFNGFRTLSANIAVELPEAVQHSTHYRTLFLAALVLFVMTFVLNTVAEVIRLRFRKRAFQL